MRHRRGYRKLNKDTSDRLAMLRNLTLSLFKAGKIETTLQRAKEARKFAESLITTAKKGDLSARKKVISKIHNIDAAKNIFKVAKERFEGRNGGYTRITRLRRRKGDAAVIVLLEIL